MTLKEKLQTYFKKNLTICFTVLAIAIVVVVLFKYPNPGVADQGDFDRVMFSSGLNLLDSDLNNPDFMRFYNYSVTDYKISSNIVNFSLTLIGSSLGYLIFVISRVCKLLGQEVFKTQYLAVAYSGIYVFSLVTIFKNLNIKSQFKKIFVGGIILFVFLDGNYLRWFNSLYGEPMMITSLTLLIATFLSYINYKYVKKMDDKIGVKILCIVIAAFVFLGSKMQVITTLPFIVILIVKVLWDNKKLLSKTQLSQLIILLCILIIYPVQMNVQNSGISNDTNFNSVFFGVLNGSETPEQDLTDLGLNPDMAVEAGKSAYEDAGVYVKYSPKKEITQNEFYSKISNGKLAKFYITHPIRLIEGMEYTAGKAFITSSSLGVYSREYSEESITEFERFTSWSIFRENNFVGKLWFILGVVFIIFISSLYKYIKSKDNLEIRNKIILIWGIMLIGGIQFPMPFVGNGKADTAKQLYLFNFVFDILIVVLITAITYKVFDFIIDRVRGQKDK